MQQRRNEILLGAARAFAQGGFDATNMDDIARECGLGKGHIYFYFPSKEEIFAEIRAGAIALALGELSEIVAAGLSDPINTLRASLSGLIAGVFKPQGRYAIVLADPVSLSRANRNRIRTLQRQYEQTFADILRDGIAKGQFTPGDPKLMTFVMLRAANSVATWYREGGEWKPEWIVRQVTDQLVRSVCGPGVGRRRRA